MGTELQTKMKNHSAKTYWGGDKDGRCLQITSSRGAQLFIQLNLDEAIHLSDCLNNFIHGKY